MPAAVREEADGGGLGGAALVFVAMQVGIVVFYINVIAKSGV